MERQELVDLLNGLQWYQAWKWDVIKLVNIELAPKIKFDIKHHKYSKTLGGELGFIDRWNVGFVIHGCESGLVFETPEQVKSYMLLQYDRLSKYLTLIGKREKLSERIRPLHNKWFNYGNDIFELAKEV